MSPSGVLSLTLEHLGLVAAAMSLAVVFGLPLGVLAVSRPALRRVVLGFANLLQTVPSLALFGLLLPVPWLGGIGARAAIVALVLYALLPIVRNTVTGIEGVRPDVLEAARAMGMTDGQILRQVELPLAAPVILAGVRVATVTCVGVATIAAAVGAGGLGTLIFRGLRMDDNALVLMGAGPAALLAFAADWTLARIESVFRPGRRTKGSSVRRRVLGGALVFAVVGVGALLGLRRAAEPPRAALGPARGGGPGPGAPTIRPLVVGSKDFTEQLLLGEILAQTWEQRGLPVERRFDLGGNLCHEALVAGRIDAYPEYTGTAYTVMLKHEKADDPRVVYDEVRRVYAARFGVLVSEPLGFRNDFAILVRGEDARRLHLATLSESVPEAAHWRAGFGQDFLSRPDGYAGFVKTYGFTFAAPPREMDLSLTYRALAAHEVDLIAGNSTDGLIDALDLAELRDDRHYFPPYEAVFLLRKDAAERAPVAADAIARLAHAIPTETMRKMNYEVDGKHRRAYDVAREWREGHGM